MSHGHEAAAEGVVMRGGLQMGTSASGALLRLIPAVAYGVLALARGAERLPCCRHVAELAPQQNTGRSHLSGQPGFPCACLLCPVGRAWRSSIHRRHRAWGGGAVCLHGCAHSA